MAKRLSQQEYTKRAEMFKKGFHWCSKCKQFKAVDQFNKSKGSAYGLYNWCKDCHANSRNGDRVMLDKYNKRNRQLVEHFTQLSGGKCQRCGYDRYNAALDFHHVNRNEKEEQPMAAVISGNVKRARAELNKCVLLCANCHRAYEAGHWRCEFVKRQGLGWTIKANSIIETAYDEVGELPEKFLYSQLGFGL